MQFDTPFKLQLIFFPTTRKCENFCVPVFVVNTESWKGLKVSWLNDESSQIWRNYIHMAEGVLNSVDDIKEDIKVKRVKVINCFLRDQCFCLFYKREL